ncbi:Ser-Thr-rich glycosyl-phosphatidyl-inositol-anchored membrane family-domain-containing protein [Pyrenochaeta sp. MPI-SDFR-AT-0127]|nr:Ser-Thr-rich glycosyl-phosphatidyl-inositol-anchored membrane family-domain-containing protein [Pyrenochaeta sp. MPI-SDFR-AT-0127]
MFTKASIATLFASLAAAQLHAPVGQPNGNPITRPLNEVVPACKAFTITWQPTTPNTVSVLLLKGPSTNVVKFGPSLAEGIANSGSLAWTPASDLEATSGPTGYGIQIIDDVTGQYQYSTQFGISKEGCSVVVSSSAKPASSGADGYPVSTPAASKSSVASGYPVSSAHVSSVAPPKPTAVPSTGAPAGNSTVIQPTKPITLPSSLRPSATGNATTSRLPEATGAASVLQAGLSLAGAAAAIAFML